MFKKPFYEDTIRRGRRLIDGKISYRKLFIIISISCIFFLWIISKFFFADNNKAIKGELTGTLTLDKYF
jgi:hypothetical protein